MVQIQVFTCRHHVVEVVQHLASHRDTPRGFYVAITLLREEPDGSNTSINRICLKHSARHAER